MGDEVSHGSATSRLSWHLLNLVSRFLEPDERDTVCGDLTECSANGGRALSEVLGLVAPGSAPARRVGW